MTPLQRIRRRRAEEPSADQPASPDVASDRPEGAPDSKQLTALLAAASPATDPSSDSVAPPGARMDHTSVADAAAAVAASADVSGVIEPPVAATPVSQDGETHDHPVVEAQPEVVPEPVVETTPDEAEPEPEPGTLRRFGRWASGRPVEDVTADAAPEPESTDAVAGETETETGPAIAGTPVTPARGPSSRARGRLRRRVRYLQKARELGLRDLGGLMFDQYRFRSPNPELLEAKLVALRALDSERRALEHILGEHREFDDLREPGIGACPNCGALHASDARYCEVCGTRQGASPAEPSPAP